MTEHEEPDDGSIDMEWLFADDFWASARELGQLDTSEDTPKLSDIARLIKENSEVENPGIFKFALVYVDNETGKLQVMANPGASQNGITNLLTRAASVMAFQGAQQESAMEHAKAHLMARIMGGENPGGMRTLADAIRDSRNYFPNAEDDEASPDAMSQMREGYL